MKALIAKFGVAALVTLAPLALHAQTRSVVYGRTTICLASQLTQQLTANGVTVTDLSGNALANGCVTFTANSGVIDLSNAWGEVIHTGGLLVKVQGMMIEIKDFDLDVTGPTSAVISGLYIVDGKFMGRQSVFMVNKQPNISLPLVPQNGTLAVSGLSLGLSQSFVSQINSTLGQNVLTTSTQVGTASAMYTLGAAGTY